MLNIILNFSFFAAIAIFAIVFFIKSTTFQKDSWIIAITLFILWFALYLAKDNVNQNNALLKPWVLPIILSLFQFTQVVFRVPLGILSQKLSSRKMVVLIATFSMLTGVLIMIVGKFSLWSLVVGMILIGIFGSTFGLDAQFISEHWKIEEAFRSSAIVFILPVLGSFLAEGIFDVAPKIHIDTAKWFLLAAMGIMVITLIGFTFFKENPKAFRIDNMDSSELSVEKRSKIDIVVLIVGASITTFVYIFTENVLTHLYIGKWEITILNFLSLFFSMVVGLLLIKTISSKMIRKVSLGLTFAPILLIAVLLLSGQIDKTALMLLMSISSIGYGSYIIALFGTTLHLDHKYPALVLGIWLSVKSFATGASEVSSQEILLHGVSTFNIGALILVIALIGFVLVGLNSVYYFIKEDNKYQMIDDLIKDMVQYELENSSKLVISNKTKIN